jgi:hypothetical protein
MLNVFAAVAAEVTHLLPVQIDDVVSAPGGGTFFHEVRIRRLSCLHFLIDAFEPFRGKLSCDPIVHQRGARHERVSIRRIITKFVA